MPHEALPSPVLKILSSLLVNNRRAASALTCLLFKLNTLHKSVMTWVC